VSFEKLQLPTLPTFLVQDAAGIQSSGGWPGTQPTLDSAHVDSRNPILWAARRQVVYVQCTRT